MTMRLEERLAAIEAELTLAKAQPPQPKHRKNKKRLYAVAILASIIGIALLLAVLVPGIRSGKNPENPAKEIVMNLQRQVGFQLLYPTGLPDNIEVKPSTATYEDADVVGFSLTSETTNIIITEQPRPQELEEIKKVRTMSMSAGQAFIADLEGRKTGFLVTDTTMVTISGATEHFLEKLLASLTPVSR